MARKILKAGDIVRHRTISREMIVTNVLDADTIECTYLDGGQKFTRSVSVEEVEKVKVPRDPAAD